jgi:hypothetical protein
MSGTGQTLELGRRKFDLRGLRALYGQQNDEFGAMWQTGKRCTDKAKDKQDSRTSEFVLRSWR